MKNSQLQYSLDKKYIATEPTIPQHNSKLMLINRNKNTISHAYFHELPNILTPNDILVFNQTKVIKANIIGNNPKTDILLINKLSDINAKETVYKCLGKKIPKINEKIYFKENLIATVSDKQNKYITLEFNKNYAEIEKYLEKYGRMPIPPYIRKKRASQIKSKTYDDEKTYQTSYAKNAGSIAAPTAGLHFTKKLLSDLKNADIQSVFVTLHVGLGTFEPITNDDLTQHKMHSEYFTLTPDVAQFLNKQKRLGKRIIAVGTTSTRVLESCSDNNGILHPDSRETDIFIYPPYKFKFVDKLITNFHLPGSTLLALVSAFVSKPNTKNNFKDFQSSTLGKAYENAMRENYRFYSYGDGMLIT